MLPSVLPVSSTSAPLRFGWLRRRKPQFEPLRHPQPQTTRRGAGAARHTTSALQIFLSVLPLPLLSRELRSYDSQDAKLQPLVLRNRVRSTSIRLLASPLFRALSTRDLPLSCRKRSAPNPEEPLRQPAKAENSDALRVQSNPRRSVPLR
jgi:hypothetical protein